MIRYVQCLFSFLMAGSAYAVGPRPDAVVPASWAGFQSSIAAQDVRLVRNIEAMKWWDLCAQWGKDVKAKSQSRKSVAIREYLLDAKLLNSVDLMTVGAKMPAVGQTTCGVFAVLGAPNKVNSTNTALTAHAQLVYRDRGIYVYTDGQVDDGNGVVRSIQY